MNRSKLFLENSEDNASTLVLFSAVVLRYVEPQTSEQAANGKRAFREAEFLKVGQMGYD